MSSAAACCSSAYCAPSRRRSGAAAGASSTTHHHNPSHHPTLGTSSLRLHSNARNSRREHRRVLATGPSDASDAEQVAPEDYAMVAELLDSGDGNELKEKVELIAKNGLLTKGVVAAARVVVEQNEAGHARTLHTAFPI